MNLKLPAQLLKSTLMRTWDAADPLIEIPFAEIARLTREKYSRREWNEKF